MQVLFKRESVKKTFTVLTADKTTSLGNNDRERSDKKKPWALVICIPKEILYENTRHNGLKKAPFHSGDARMTLWLN